MYKFSENLKRLRKEAGMTQRGLAKLVGVSSNYISKLENGGNPKLIVLVNLADVFNVTCNFLCGLDNQ